MFILRRARREQRRGPDLGRPPPGVRLVPLRRAAPGPEGHPGLQSNILYVSSDKISQYT